MSKERARELRNRMSPAEARMWILLRQAPFKAFHFRRQVPIGAYYADFASHAARLVIEIDGETHGSAAAMAYDAQRDHFLSSQGYRVLRFSNGEVMRHVDGVGLALLNALTPTRPGLAGPPLPIGKAKWPSRLQSLHWSDRPAPRRLEAPQGGGRALASSGPLQNYSLVHDSEK